MNLSATKTVYMQFTLRPWNEQDVNSLVANANNSNIARFMTDSFPHPYTAENARAFIAMATKDDPVHIFAIDVEGKSSRRYWHSPPGRCNEKKMPNWATGWGKITGVKAL